MKVSIIILMFLNACSTITAPTSKLNKNVNISITTIDYLKGKIYFKIENNNDSDIFIRQSDLVSHSVLTYKSGKYAKQIRKINPRNPKGFQEFILVKKKSVKPVEYATQFFSKFNLEKDSVYVYKSTYSNSIIKKGSPFKTLTGEIPSGYFVFKYKTK